MTSKTKRKPTKRKLVTQKAGPVDKRRRKRGLTAAVRIAIDAMVFDRCTRAEACERAGITERGFYLALEKPEVAAHWNRSIVVLRSGERAANIHRLAKIRDAADNMPAVKSIQVLEQLDAEAAVRPIGVETPGVCINIITAPAAPDAPMTTIDITPVPARTWVDASDPDEDDPTIFRHPLRRR